MQANLRVFGNSTVSGNSFYYGTLQVDGILFGSDLSLTSLGPTPSSITLTDVKIKSDYGDPEGIITAPIGSIYLRPDGASGTCAYIKESGTGNTGWKSILTSVPASSLLPITLDTVNNRVGINKTTPTSALEVAGTILATGTAGNITASGIVSGAQLTVTGNSEIYGWLQVNDTFYGTNIELAALSGPASVITLTNTTIKSDNGDPEGVMVAPVGSLYLRPDGGAGTCAYIKETGTGNTGWKPILTAMSGAITLTTAAQPNITSLGTLSSLGVTGAVSAGSMSASSGNFGTLSVVNNTTVGGSVSATTLTGTLSTAAQPNITSVGTLGSLAVTGAVTAGSLGGTISTAAQPSITSVGTLGSLAVTGAVTAGSLGGTISTAAQPNITSVGTLGSLAVTGTATANTFSATTLTGTLSTASQPNVTSVGTLGSLAVTGTATANTFSATTLTGTLSTAAQPNVTSLGSLTSLSTGLITPTYSGTAPTSATIGYTTATTSSTTVPTTTIANLQSTTITSGVWLVEGEWNATCTNTSFACSLSTTSATHDSKRMQNSVASASAIMLSVQVTSVFAVSASTTIYAVGKLNGGSATTGEHYIRTTRIA